MLSARLSLHSLLSLVQMSVCVVERAHLRNYLRKCPWHL